MKEALHAWKDVDAYPEVVTLKTMIMRNKLTAIVYTRMMPKHYGVMYNKQVVTDDFTTIPYGYLKIKEDSHDHHIHLTSTWGH